MRPLIAGNWKMNGLAADLAEIAALRGMLAGASGLAAEVLICPPATLVARAALAAADSFAIGAQDCHAEPRGAFTGDISAEMLRDAGATAVILGHSERRRHHGETNEAVAAKAAAAWRAGLRAIICIGETGAEREAGEARRVCAAHIAGSVPAGADAANTAIAYEPVWAIGTGLTPTADEIAEIHRHVRERLVARLGAAGGAVPILYGGSVNGANAKEILALDAVGGALVGGASLKAVDFWRIIEAAPRTF